jgi:heme o synthase
MSSSTVAREPVAALLADFGELAKARLSLLVLLTTLVGFLLGWTGPMNFGLLAATLIGTAMCAAGASTLNQWWERDLDARMKRTRDRPLPSGRVHPKDALLLGLFLSVFGISILLLFTNIRAGFLAFATIAIYVLIYTPMKRMTSLNTLVGAVPGALPPLIGWVAARGTYNLEGCLLFAILWFWQMPHFLAIAWLYRDDYKAGGFAMLTNNDPTGLATSGQSLLYALCLIPVTLLPVLVGFNATWFFFAALILGGAFAWVAFRFLLRRERPRARSLFLASILYLPAILVCLVASRL